jgi:hypothetical protein
LFAERVWRASSTDANRKSTSRRFKALAVPQIGDRPLWAALFKLGNFFKCIIPFKRSMLLSSNSVIINRENKDTFETAIKVC